MSGNFYRWQNGHRGKVAYRSWYRAQRRRWHVWLASRDWMQVYRCRWDRRYRQGETGPPHWHIGHPGRGYHGPVERLRRAWRRRVLWPALRLRHRYRVARGTAVCQSSSCAAHRASLRRRSS